MATPTTPPDTPPFQLPPGLDVYDALMGDIDIDLVSTSIPRLAEKYKGETSEERAARYKRYEAAFEKFDASFEDWNANLQLSVSALRRQALQSAEARSKEEETAILRRLESTMDAA